MEMPRCLNDLTQEEVKTFFDSFDTILTDCDGVLWMEKSVINNSNTTLNKFRVLGKKVYYVTNNSTKTREEFVEKCEKLGFIANWNDIINTSYLAAEYLNSISFEKKVFVIGSEAITKELDRFHIKHTGIEPDVLDTNLEKYIREKLTFDPDVGAVLIGFDENFSFPKILKATNYLKNPSCLFIATNADENVTVDNLLIPGTGSLVRCLETATGREAYVIGKPNDYIVESVKKNCHIDPARTLMIGDRCNTDILFGKKCGFKTLLVLTGVTSYEEMEKFASSQDPTERDLAPEYYVRKLGDLMQYMS